MKRRKVLAMLTTAVMTLSTIAPDYALMVRAEDDVVAEEEAVTEEVLPYGLKGMPEGYTLDAEELEMKASLQENEVLTVLQGMKEGGDYVEDTVICLAEDEEEAQTIAKAYNAELICYAQGVAEIRLPETLSVAEALSVAQDEKYDLPVVEPNYITRLDDPEEIDFSGFIPDSWEAGSDSTTAAKTPAMTWKDWVMGDSTTPALMSNPDTYLRDPASPYYQWHLEAVDTYKAWMTTMGSNAVTVAVIDNGVNPDHPDLKGRVTQVKVNNLNPSAYTNSHGTNVAGIIAASANNGIGVAGVAPKVNILSLNVFGGTDGATSAAELRALQICMERNVQVVNMSIGKFAYSASEEQLIQQMAGQNICIFAAMGNENAEARSYPGGYRDTIAVAAVTASGERSQFSNYGSWADIAAPGCSIMSCYNPKANDKKNSADGAGNYGLMSGTSQATPIAAGAAALYVSLKGQVSPSVMKNLMQATGTKAKSKNIGKILNVGKLIGSGGAKAKAKAVQSPDLKSFILEMEDAEEGSYALYTTDGTEPILMDGAVVYGNLYTGSVDLVPEEGKDSVTVKTRVVTASGEVGEVESFTFNVPADGARDTTAATKAAGGIIVTEVYGRVINNKAEIFSVNVPGTTYDDSSLVLNAGLPATWTSSNSKVLQLSATEGPTVTVGALKADSAKITCKTSDGAKAMITVKVIVPVSGLVLDTSAEGYCGAIALGKSKKLTPIIGTAYGKPSKKKLEWDYSVNNDISLTAALKAAKAVSISSSGKVSINKKKWESIVNASALTYAALLYVTASTTDGTNLKDTTLLFVHKCPTYISLCDSSLTKAGIKVFTLQTDGSWYNDLDGGFVQDYTLYFAVDTLIPSIYEVEVTSSDPSLVGVIPAGMVMQDANTPLIKNLRMSNGMRRVCFYQVDILPSKDIPRTGTVKITFKMNDGSNKKETITLKIV